VNFNSVHNVYLIGIGGIGMSALARYFNEAKKYVAGYDKTPTDLTRSLSESGIKVSFEDSVELIDAAFFNLKNTLIIYTPAIPSSHKQLQYFMQNGFQVLKRSQVLGLITEQTFCLAVAGTHGKTTTTSILGHLMYSM
jgi:UDP-N-acetylmuramate--alanine ligase